MKNFIILITVIFTLCFHQTVLALEEQVHTISVNINTIHGLTTPEKFQVINQNFYRISDNLTKIDWELYSQRRGITWLGLQRGFNRTIIDANVVKVTKNKELITTNKESITDNQNELADIRQAIFTTNQDVALAQKKNQSNEAISNTIDIRSINNKSGVARNKKDIKIIGHVIDDINDRIGKLSEPEVNKLIQTKKANSQYKAMINRANKHALKSAAISSATPVILPLQGKTSKLNIALGSYNGEYAIGLSGANRLNKYSSMFYSYGADLEGMATTSRVGLTFDW